MVVAEGSFVREVGNFFPWAMEGRIRAIVVAALVSAGEMVHGAAARVEMLLPIYWGRVCLAMEAQIFLSQHQGFRRRCGSTRSDRPAAIIRCEWVNP